MKKNDEPTDLLKKILTSSNPSDSKERDYQVTKSLPKPSHIEPEGKKLSASSTKQLATTEHPTYPLDFPTHAYALRNREVRKFSGKERQVARKQLLFLSQEMQDWIHTHVYQEVKQVGKEEIVDYHNMERMEERQFQINRIIKYLSDP